MSLRTGFHTPGPFVHGEVVERQGRGVNFRLAAGDWRRQLHAASLGRLHVLVAAVEGVGQHRLWQQFRLCELIEHRHHCPAVGLRGTLRLGGFRVALDMAFGALSKYDFCFVGMGFPEVGSLGMEANGVGSKRILESTIRRSLPAGFWCGPC